MEICVWCCEGQARLAIASPNFFKVRKTDQSVELAGDRDHLVVVQTFRWVEVSLK